VKALRNICQKEGIKASIEVLNQIAEHSLGDLRAAVNDLQSLSEGKEEIDKVVLGYRDAKTTIFASLAEIFKGVKCQKSRQSVSNLDETPDHIILWIDENLPLEYKDLGDLARGYDALSRADIYLGMVKRRQHYGFWSYAIDMMTAGGLIKMSRTKRVRNTSRSLATKLGDYCHASNDIVLRDIIPYFKHLFATDRDFRINMTHILHLNEDEIGYLLGEKVDSYAVKHVVDGVERLSESKKIKTIKEFEKKEKQAGLFDF
jgi:replication factor C large subunit